jgi:hypothetical protein
MDAVYGEEKRGQPPYDPRMMAKVLVYGYCVGVFSSRRIERRLVEDIAFRILAAGNQPNFRTISDFRKIHLKTLAGMFEQVLKIALEPIAALRSPSQERADTPNRFEQSGVFNKRYGGAGLLGLRY